eukprot:TRINITY_DN6490_c0_g2_i1.p2 TRINITY_DN6490_c0_g2~~TRINITY_DN6490_c0_g2_i1.p2  ORF type:complete len:302 (+),score=86.70 TRINITY_DN6490_c0_g2_i1:3-908(+)
MTRGAAIGLAQAAGKKGWYCWVVAAGGETVVLRADKMPPFPIMIDEKRAEVKELTKEEGVAAASKAGNETRKKKAKGGAVAVLQDLQAREEIKKLREDMQAIQGQGGDNKMKKQLVTVWELARKARREVDEVRQEVRDLEEKVSSAWTKTNAAVEANTSAVQRVEQLLLHLVNAQVQPQPQPQPQPPQCQPQQQPQPQPQPQPQSQPQPQPAPATHQETPARPSQQTTKATLIEQITGGPYQPPEPQTPARDSRKQGRSSTAETPGGTTLNAAKKKPACSDTERAGIIASLPDDSDDAIYN